MRRMNRRTVLHGALGVAVAAAVRPAFAQVPAIGGDLSVLAGVGGNVVVLKTSDGAVLIDSGAAGANGRVFDFLEAATGSRRVHTLFNTHWHLDQIGANEALGNAGANIVAHEKTRLRLAVGYYLPTEDRYLPPVAVKAQPTESFYTTGSTTVGGKRIEYGYLIEAHTSGDIYIFFRDSNVLAVGDVAMGPPGSKVSRPRYKFKCT